MADLVVLPDIESLVVDFLLDQDEITDIFDDYIVTALRKDKADYMLRVTQFDDQPVARRPLHAVRTSLQFESYGGAKRTARRNGETVRAALAARLAGVYDTAVVTRVDCSGMRDLPDETFPNARPRWIFVATVTAHPPRNTGS